MTKLKSIVRNWSALPNNFSNKIIRRIIRELFELTKKLWSSSKPITYEVTCWAFQGGSLPFWRWGRYITRMYRLFSFVKKLIAPWKVNQQTRAKISLSGLSDAFGAPTGSNAAEETGAREQPLKPATNWGAAIHNRQQILQAIKVKLLTKLVRSYRLR